MFATNISLTNWQAVTQAPVFSGNALVVSFPFSNASGYFRLQQTNSAGSGGCLFQATPPQINSGASSLLTWCPQAGTSYRISPGPGAVTGSSLAVSPTNTTVYSLISSNAQGMLTNNAAVIVGPCGWLQVSNWDVTLGFTYSEARSTPSYNFQIDHEGDITFHLVRDPTSTDTDAYYFGFATDGALDRAFMDDREDDKTGPSVFTTTETSTRFIAPDHTVSTFSLHLTCTTYSFSYNVLMITTETSQFGTDTSLDGLATGAVYARPLSNSTNVITLFGVFVPAEYPPANLDYFTPSSSLGEAMFNTGTTTSSTAGDAVLDWTLKPEP